MPLSNRSTGISGEETALSYLRKHAYKILERNFRSKFGEIDLIALKDGTVFFIEVKFRMDDAKGKPYEAVGKSKIMNILRTSQFYLLNKGYKDYKLKLAVISIIGSDGSIEFYDDVVY